jgi:hypothetical protein
MACGAGACVALPRTHLLGIKVEGSRYERNRSSRGRSVSRERPGSAVARGRTALRTCRLRLARLLRSSEADLRARSIRFACRWQLALLRLLCVGLLDELGVEQGRHLSGQRFEALSAPRAGARRAPWSEGR